MTTLLTASLVLQALTLPLLACTLPVVQRSLSSLTAG